MAKLFIGIDVSKSKSTAQGIDINGEKVFYTEFSMDTEGFSKLTEKIFRHCDNPKEVQIAMESTGCYHVNLLSLLLQKGLICYVINPLLIANFTRLSLRKTKTDRKDAMSIAQFLLIYRASLATEVFSQDMQDLKDLAREKESLTGLIASIKTDLKRMLQITFPELESKANVYSQAMLSFLRKFPSARTIKIADTRAIAGALRHKDGRMAQPFTAHEIKELARNSVASDSIAKELILPEKIATILHLIDRKARMSKVLVELCMKVKIDDIEIVTSIGGISNKTASAFLAELGDYTRFKSHKNLIAFAGLDPSINQSGQFEGKSRISKRGNKHLRHIIYMMTSCVVRNSNVFRDYFLRRKSEGLPFKKAIMATAHKLLRTIFAMLKTKSHYRKGVMHNS